MQLKNVSGPLKISKFFIDGSSTFHRGFIDDVSTVHRLIDVSSTFHRKSINLHRLKNNTISVYTSLRQHVF